MAPATKATQKRLDAAVSAFNARYADSKQWGDDRWFNSLYPALVRPTSYTAVINQYAVSLDEAKALLTESDDELEQVEFQNEPQRNLVVCYRKRSSQDSNVEKRPRVTVPFPVPKQISSSNGQLLTHWNMDAASVLTAYMLDVRPGHRLLDMCAAPGGKAVVLAQTLFPALHKDPLLHPHSMDTTTTGCLHVNELDPTRCKRLASNLKSYLPSCLFPTAAEPRAPVKVLNYDLSTKIAVSTLPLGLGGYDRVLVDAPCSSERHIIHAYEKAKASGHVAEDMLNWKASHVTTLVKTQTGLLQTATKAVKTGGLIVYATCALGFEENDGVVKKVLETISIERRKAKKEGMSDESWEIQPLMGTESVTSSLHLENDAVARMTEPTAYGRIALPDSSGWGPLYFSVLARVEKPRKTKLKPTQVSTAADNY